MEIESEEEKEVMQESGVCMPACREEDIACKLSGSRRSNRITFSPYPTPSSLQLREKNAAPPPPPPHNSPEAVRESVRAKCRKGARRTSPLVLRR